MIPFMLLDLFQIGFYFVHGIGSVADLFINEGPWPARILHSDSSDT